MASGRRPRVIFFDAGNTLLRIDVDVIAATLRRHGVITTADTVERAEWRARVRLDTEVLRPASGSTEHGDVADRYLGYVVEGLGVTDRAVVEALLAWRRTYNRPVGFWNVAAPAAAAALALVRASDVRAAVISNSNGSVRSILESLGLAQWLEFVLDSGEVGVEKPDPEIFRVALARAGVAAEEAVYIGDLYSIDVLGARAAGIDAILLDPGACWGERDCRMAPDVLAAVRLALSGQAARAPATPSAVSQRDSGEARRR